MTDSEKILIGALVLALATVGAGAGLRAITRGIKNNNPGNIRKTSIPWQGKVPLEQNTDPHFEQFTAPVWGLRAIVKELQTNFRRGENTIAEIISEWAPSTENPTEALVASAARRLNVAPDAPLSTSRIPELVDAIVLQENGVNPYPRELVAEAVRLAA